jgi:serine/threonine-protein kinase
MVNGKFSRYEILEKLGEGGMAEVYRAYDPDFNRDVALKILRREMLEDGRMRKRFKHETKVIANLELEGIVPV